MPFEGRRILVVDDEEGLREGLKDLLQDMGATVATAENGRRAFELLAVEEFDAVITDLRMPGGDGLSLSRDIQGLRRKPKLLVCSAFGDLSAEEARSLGIVAIIGKPFELDALMGALRTALGV